MKIQMQTETGLNKRVKLGYSWTTLLFGFFVPLIRGDLKWFAIMFLLGVLIGIPTFGIGALVIDIVFSFVYNKIYVKELIAKGYKPVEKEGVSEINKRNIASVSI